MKDYKTLFFLGVIALVVPFLGIPEMFKDWIIAIVAIIIIFYSLYTRKLIKKDRQEDKEVFVESRGDVRQEEIKPEVYEEAEEFEEKVIQEDNE